MAALSPAGSQDPAAALRSLTCGGAAGICSPCRRLAAPVALYMSCGTGRVLLSHSSEQRSSAFLMTTFLVSSGTTSEWRYQVCCCLGHLIEMQPAWAQKGPFGISEEGNAQLLNAHLLETQHPVAVRNSHLVFRPSVTLTGLGSAQMCRTWGVIFISEVQRALVPQGPPDCHRGSPHLRSPCHL